ncbi:MAG TPA: hypothetical protein VJ596_03470 [Gemmatimonadaceae bacterium]|nr:hypothetical protein [Gemmatimonadaceae bacterium]
MSGNDYRIFGLRLRANRPLPNLEPISRQAAADIVVELMGSPPSTGVPLPVAGLEWRADDPAMPVWKARTADGTSVRLRYAGAGSEAEFVIEPSGRRVWVWWSEDVTLDDVSAVLLGTILACVLSARGVTTLHGSVVSVGGQAIAMLGVKGAGKSTTALALVQRGATLVSDDIVALAEAGDGFRVHPGQRQLRLLPTSASALCDSSETLRPMWSQTEARPLKRYLDVPGTRDSLSESDLPLAAIYVLAPRSQLLRRPAVSSASGIAAVPLLMAHRSVPFMLDRDGHGRDFALLTRLAGSTPVRTVQRPDRLQAIGEIAEAILEDMHARV